MVVLDDDPTGIQTVHGCLLITDWSDESVREAFLDREPFFYILTNTRAMTRKEAAAVTRQAMEAVVRVNREFGYRLVVVSRSDSCLRGHFPLETDVMRQVLTDNGIVVWPRVPFCPAFIEAGRYTIDGVHYMKDGGRLIPVSETEFARDNVFAYHTSVLADYIKEKGARLEDYDIVNAQTYEELYNYVEQLMRDTDGFNGAVVVRSSSSFPKAMSGIEDRGLLEGAMLEGQASRAVQSIQSTKEQGSVGCFIVGSHVQKTTRQLNQLLEAEGTAGIEVDVQRLLTEPELLMKETLNTLAQAAAAGQTPVVYTSRQELRLTDADQRQHLGQRVSDFLVDIVRRLPFVPAYLVGKGGITSHDILTKGLGVKSARVLGQVINSVPCVMADRFPYIIFPGNVGDDSSLRAVYDRLRRIDESEENGADDEHGGNHV